MHRYFGIITARKGSKGIPRKNMQPILEKPMLQYTLEAARDSLRLDFCILSSDDHEAIKLAKKHHIEAPFVRPAKLSDDYATADLVVAHALEWYVGKFSKAPNTLVLLQPTSPFRTSTDIDEAIAEYEKNDKESLVSACEVINHPSDCITINFKGEIERVVPVAPNTAGRQGYKKVYFIDGGIYISNVERFRKKKKMFDEKSAVHLIPTSHGIDIDDSFDLDLARAMAYYSKNVKNIF